MKQVTYLGQTFNVPDEANYISADGDGRVFAYEKMPTWFPNLRMMDSDGNFWHVGNIDVVPCVLKI
jgi:hypothetical protein